MPESKLDSVEASKFDQPHPSYTIYSTLTVKANKIHWLPYASTVNVYTLISYFTVNYFIQQLNKMMKVDH